MLAELMRMKQGIAVAGSHGKTTATSMVATVLAGSGLDPTIVVGGQLAMIGSMAKLGRGDLLVAEADESDGSFLHLTPTLAVVTNVDREHLDHYGSMQELRQAFIDFLNRVPFYGAGIVCLDDPGVRALLPDLERRTVTYGLNPQADLVAEDLRTEEGVQRFAVRAGGRKLGEATLTLPGAHNVANALAALAVALEIGLSFERAAEALRAFEGVDRRFQRRGEVSGVTVVDDYAHHPTEIRATLAAAREQFGGRRLVVGFQPHRFTRSRDLADEFGGAFHDADTVLIGDIYPAGERPIHGVTAEALAAGVADQGHRDVRYVGSLDQLVEAMVSQARPGDVLVTLGAGDISGAAEVILRLLARRKNEVEEA
jgi:UDP-N-acetylmuramate--alanine ligase